MEMDSNLAPDFCDIGHQAIAFIGSCPLCRVSKQVALHRVDPREAGNGGYTYIPELRGKLKQLISEGAF